jgi:hypothetical protein
MSQYISYKTKTLVETAIYRVSKTHSFIQLALNPTVLNYEQFAVYFLLTERSGFFVLCCKHDFVKAIHNEKPLCNYTIRRILHLPKYSIFPHLPCEFWIAIRER